MQNASKWEPPRGIRLIHNPACVRRPFAVQWRADGKRKSVGFPSEEAQVRFAKGLAADATANGTAAFRLDEGEARAWRAFVLQLNGAPLDGVLACWQKYGAPAAVSLSVPEAIKQFLEAKKAEGLATLTLAHYRPVMRRFQVALGNLVVGAVKREDVVRWLDGLNCADVTRARQLKYARTFFGWLKSIRAIVDDPCEGIKNPRLVQAEVETWTPDEFRSLFEKNECEPPELLGRLACECFAGLRFGSAAQLNGSEDFKDGGIVLPAAKIKTRRRQFIDGLPDNLWFWVNRSEPAKWQMTQRQYLAAKSRAVVRAGLKPIHNACRHGFGTYVMAVWRDAARVAAALCHTNQKMLYGHYKGRATEAQGIAYLLIYPTGACCAWPRK